MSFYFAKGGKNKGRQGPSVAAGAVLAAPGTRTAKQNAATLGRLGCDGCPHNATGEKLGPTLVKGADVYIVAESPEWDEKLVRECIPKGQKASFDNIVNCTSDHTPTWQEAECCRPRRIKWIEEAKPKLILGLGVVPLKFFLNSTDIDGMRGRLFAIQVGSHSCWFMPTFDPDFIRKKAYDKKKPLNSRLGYCFRMDISRALDIGYALQSPSIPSHDTIRGSILVYNGDGALFLELIDLLKEAIKAPVKAVDIETKGLRPFSDGAAIMTVAISYDDVNFSFAVDHPKAGWTGEQKQQILVLLEELLKDDAVKVAHNAPFELEWFISYFGLGVVNHAAWECTQMQAQFLDERRGKAHGSDDSHRAAYQSLDFLVKQHFGISYKSDFKLNKRDMSKSDLAETLVYNAVDTKYTLRLYHHQIRLLKKIGTHEAYLEALPRQPAVALMQTLGVMVDQKEVKRIQSMLQAELTGIYQTINSLNVVQAYVKDKGEFNPLSDKDAVAIFRDYLKRPEVSITKDGKTRFSTDKNVLGAIDHPLAASILLLRNKNKLKSTYCDGLELGKGELVYPDGKIHCNFNTTFAETGRTSCVAYWTLIRVPEGYKAIKDIKVGDLVWTHKGRWRKVTATWIKGHEQMYDVCLSNGQVLTCTKKHRLLKSNDEWTTVGELNGFLQEMGIESEECESSLGCVSQQENTFSKGNCPRVGNQRQQCLVGYQELLGQRRTQSAEDATLLSVKNRRQEPNEGQILREASKLEGGVQRWLRVSDDKNPRRTDLCSSSSDNEGVQLEGNSKWMGNSSHRWESGKQQPRQLSCGDEDWASSYSHQGKAGFTVIEIEEIKISGSYEVFDITVEEDASYQSCSVFSHNSDEPNMQNFPQRQDAWVRNQVVAEEGHTLVAFDYGQLEACTAAMCSGDKVLVAELWEDYDIHMDFAKNRVSVAFPEGLERVNGDMKKFRSLIKNKFVFPAIFGAQASSIAGYLNMPVPIAEKLLNQLWEKYTGLKRWQDRTVKKYYEDGFVVSPTGRRHNYPLSKNQVVNFPIQSLACDIVCRAMCDLSYLALSTKKFYLHPRLNIHDDLTFSIPDDDQTLEEAITQIYKIMLDPQLRCVNVPLSVSVSIGKSWYGMTEIGKFWSHKDL